IDVVSQKEAGADVEPEENGVTFEENALIKAKSVYDITGVPVIADDSGLCVDALGGRPSVYSARYAPKGQECEKLLDEMKGVSENDRTAYFECCIALVTSDEEPQFMTGRCYGKISGEARGNNGFGYDPVFLYGEKTLAEMTSEEKNKISHRAEALAKLCDYLRKRNGE
ncbi:MAG: RdgB/HAM1 family non-canonical purine NTP pyrophosphatase, partial [Ruminococcus sp.]|nr:RdgB/HAM1 family non-canonical purine NTP pyrophosphatase [Ruminococcus sp.]